MVYHNITNSIYVMCGSTTGGFRFADVWRFNLTSNRWTWIGGSSSLNVGGNYGTKGVAASTNLPGSRDSTILVTDANGFLYTFGGFGLDGSSQLGHLNDLWRFDLSTYWFTWLTGTNSRNQFGSYGTQGVEALANSPGGRTGMGIVFHPGTNSLYIYGGSGYDSAGSGGLNDLWRYNITSGMWAWLNGASTSNQNAVFNIINVESSSTTPGSSYYSGMTIAPNNNAIYQFGTYRRISDVNAWSNALFRYNINTNQWAWIAGSSSASPSANYGTMNVEAPTNAIPSKLRSTMSYHPASNHLIIKGDNQNDLWRFNLTPHMWACIYGTNATNVVPTFGTLGVSATSNTPGNRQGSAGVVKPDLNSYFYFGGVLYSSGQAYGDLWQYDFDFMPVLAATSSATTTTSTTTRSTTTTSTASYSTIFSMSIGTSTINTRNSLSLTLVNAMSTLLSNHLDAGSTTIDKLVSTDSFTTVAPTSTDSPSAPSSTSSISLLLYAGAIGGVILVITVVVAVVLVRRKSAWKARKQKDSVPAQNNQTFSQTNMPPPHNKSPYGVYSTQSLQPMQLTMLTNQPSMYQTVNTIGGLSMSTSPMSQQSMTVGMGFPMNSNTNMGFPMNSNTNIGFPTITNLNMGMNGNISGTQQSMMPGPVMNSGQGAGRIMVDNYETPWNYNQFQYQT